MAVFLICIQPKCKLQILTGTQTHEELSSFFGQVTKPAAVTLCHLYLRGSLEFDLEAV